MTIKNSICHGTEAAGLLLSAMRERVEWTPSFWREPVSLGGAWLMTVSPAITRAIAYLNHFLVRLPLTETIRGEAPALHAVVVTRDWLVDVRLFGHSRKPHWPVFVPEDLRSASSAKTAAFFVNIEALLGDADVIAAVEWITPPVAGAVA